jgi:hypothetical protein
MSTYRKPFTIAGSNPRSGSQLTFKESVKRNALALVQQLLPGGKVIGKEYVIRNPKRPDTHPGSFRVCISGLKAGVWADFATNDRGGDLASLAAYIKSLSHVEAVRWLRENIKPETDSNSTSASRLTPLAIQTQRVPDRRAPTPCRKAKLSPCCRRKGPKIRLLR